jgi:hypothetical protein
VVKGLPNKADTPAAVAVKVVVVGLAGVVVPLGPQPLAGQFVTLALFAAIVKPAVKFELHGFDVGCEIATVGEKLIAPVCPARLAASRTTTFTEVGAEAVAEPTVNVLGFAEVWRLRAKAVTPGVTVVERVRTLSNAVPVPATTPYSSVIPPPPG